MCERCNLSGQLLSRRGVMFGAGALALAGLPLARALADQPTSLTPPPNAIAPEAALQRLMEGNARYAANTPQEKDYSAGRASRAVAQYPIAAVLGCADSRVSPELAFDQGPGEIFAVRIAGNFANDDALASLEYAVKFLGVPLILVLGHSKCGAVDAAIKVVQENATLPGHLPELVDSIKPAVLAAQARGASDLLAAAIEENVKLTVKRLDEDAPILSEPFASKKIDIVGGVYDLATGKVSLI